LNKNRLQAPGTIKKGKSGRGQFFASIYPTIAMSFYRPDKRLNSASKILERIASVIRVPQRLGLPVLHPEEHFNPKQPILKEKQGFSEFQLLKEI